MQIVIDIPEKIYEYYKNKYPKDCEELTFVENAFLEGTPLPKGHGRLIDADELDKCIVDRIAMPYVPINKIQDAPTIIDADKESGNDI